MPLTINEVIQNSEYKSAKQELNLTDEDLNLGEEAILKRIEAYNTQTQILRNLMDPSVPKERAHRFIDMNEVLTTSDAQYLMPRVFSDILLKPVEPKYIGQSLLCKKISVPNTARLVEIPIIGAMRAGEVGEGQEYPGAGIPMRQYMEEIRIRRFGLIVEWTDDIVNDSNWDLGGLLMEAARNALNRQKEETIFNTAIEFATTLFDNGEANASSGGGGYSLYGWTRGMANDAVTRNGTLAYDDILDAMAALIANGYTPTDILLHPMAWTTFASNPILRYHSVFGGTLGANAWGPIGPEAVQQQIPWNIGVFLTPFAPIRLSQVAYDEAGSSNSRISGSADHTDILVMDRETSLILAQREEAFIEDFRDPRRDINAMKVRERYGVGATNRGKSIVSIKNVKITRNYETFGVVRTATGTPE
jgi:hypothetical protein